MDGQIAKKMEPAAAVGQFVCVDIILLAFISSAFLQPHYMYTR
jgi:hypothetical protein